MTFGSLFTGIGGIDLGLERAGMECRWQVEIDPFCRKVLQKHWPKVSKYGDITKLTGKELEPVQLVCGGFPCQDLSQAGKRAGIEGSRSGLWFDFARIIGVVGPRYVLIENVPGLLVPGAMRRVVGELAGLGYVGIWRSLRASEFGASHLRKRVFIVAWSEGGSESRRENGWDGREVTGCTCKNLAYASEAEPFRLGGLFDGEREACGNDADGRDTDLADAECAQRGTDNEHQQLQRGRQQAANRPKSGGGDMADAAEPRSDRPAWEEQRIFGPSLFPARSRNGSGHLGDAECARRIQTGIGRYIDAGPESEAGSGVVENSEQPINRTEIEYQETRSEDAGRSASRSGGPSKYLADTGNGQLPQPGRQPERRDGSGSAGEVLSDTVSPRLEERRCQRSDDEPECGTAERDGTIRRDMADASVSGTRVAIENISINNLCKISRRTTLSANSIGCFAPGPNDPRWPAILVARPDLAPALANSGHAKRPIRRSDQNSSGGSPIGESPERGPARSESASSDEPGSAAPQSEICRMADGLSDRTHGGLDANKVGSTKSGSTSLSRSPKVPGVRRNARITAASPGSQQTEGSDDSLPVMSRSRTSEDGGLGRTEESIQELSDLRDQFHSESFEEPQHMQPGVSLGDWQKERDEAMASEIARAMRDRTKRLGRLGNAVVPQVAEWIGRRILEIEAQA